MEKVRGKTYQIDLPDGNSKTIINLKEFCKENSLDYHSLSRVARGDRKSHKKYKAKILDHGSEVVGKNQK